VGVAAVVGVDVGVGVTAAQSAVSAVS
jgi:hypothetical protein